MRLDRKRSARNSNKSLAGDVRERPCEPSDGKCEFWGNIVVNRLASFVILLFAGVFFLLSLYGSHGLLRLQAVDGDIVKMQRTAEELDAEIAKLKGQIQAAGRDNDILEQKAREELGLARPNEVIYIFPNEPRQSGTTTPLKAER